MGTRPDDHVLYSKLSFLSLLMPVTSLIMPTDDGPVLRDYTLGVQNKIQFHCVYFLIPVIDTIHLSLNYPNHLALEPEPAAIRHTIDTKHTCS